jgi:hypothetical protein
MVSKMLWGLIFWGFKNRTPLLKLNSLYGYFYMIYAWPVYFGEVEFSKHFDSH